MVFGVPRGNRTRLFLSHNQTREPLRYRHHNQLSSFERTAGFEPSLIFLGKEVPHLAASSAKSVGVRGIEPPVSASRTQRDTTSLHPVKTKQMDWELNQHHRPSDRHSRQLLSHPYSGAAYLMLGCFHHSSRRRTGRDRTGDLLSPRQARYHFATIRK